MEVAALGVDNVALTKCDGVLAVVVPISNQALVVGAAEVDAARM